MKFEPKELAENGFVIFSTNSPNQSTLDVANKIGRIESIPNISPVQTLTPHPLGLKEKSSYSGIFGMGEFPFHTDMAHWYRPPRFILLRCIQPASQVKTRLISARQLFSNEPNLTLKRALFRPRRRLDGRLTVLRLHDKDMYRWDTVFIKPINHSALELQERIALRIDDHPVTAISLECPTDCVVIDNWTMLHSRSSVLDFSAHRIIERAYLSQLTG